MGGPRAGDERSLRREGARIRTLSHRVDLSVETKVAIGFFRNNIRLIRLTFLPEVDLDGDVSNYWTLSLITYLERGTRQQGIPFSGQEPSFKTDTNTLTAQIVRHFPHVGEIGQLLPAGRQLWLHADTTGAPPSLVGLIQLDYSAGGS